MRFQAFPNSHPNSHEFGYFSAHGIFSTGTYSFPNFGDQAMASTVVDIAADADLLAAAKSEFAGIMAVTPYDCPIPDGILPPPMREGNIANLS